MEQACLQCRAEAVLAPGAKGFKCRRCGRYNLRACAPSVAAAGCVATPAAAGAAAPTTAAAAAQTAHASLPGLTLARLGEIAAMLTRDQPSTYRKQNHHCKCVVVDGSTGAVLAEATNTRGQGTVHAEINSVAALAAAGQLDTELIFCTTKSVCVWCMCALRSLRIRAICYLHECEDDYRAYSGHPQGGGLSCSVGAAPVLEHPRPPPIPNFRICAGTRSDVAATLTPASWQPKARVWSAGNSQKASPVLVRLA